MFTYLYDEGADVVFLQHRGTVRAAVGEPRRVVVDVLDVEHDQSTTCSARRCHDNCCHDNVVTCSARRAATTATVVRCRDVEWVGDT